MSSSAPKRESISIELENITRVQVHVNLEMRDRFSVDLQVSNGVIISSQLTGSGCAEALKLISDWRSKFAGKLEDVPLPDGEGHAEILFRELILKAQGRWEFPYGEDEICHCRRVRTCKVDAAIVGGCKTLAAVSRETSASTSCGTCRLDIEKIIAYRLNRTNHPK